MTRTARGAARGLGLVVFAWMLFAAPGVLTAQKPSPAKPQPRPQASSGDAFLQGAPIDVDLLVKWLTTKNRRGQLIMNSTDISRYVRARKVAFPATEENLGRLQEAGASDEVLEAVRAVAPVPETPPEPPKPAVGSLTVTCAPAECSVRVGDNPAEESKDGTLQREMTFGSLTVEVSKPGYVSEKKPVEVSAEPKTLTFSLKPDEATKAKTGAGLINKMRGALGTEPGDVLARGSWTWSQAGAAPVEWSFTARFGQAQVNLTVGSGSNTFELECKGETCEQKQSGRFGLKRKDLKGADAARADQHLRLYRRDSVWGLARALRSAGDSSRLKATTESGQPGPDGTYAVHAEVLDELYDLVLDSALLPQAASFSSKAVAGAEVKAEYYDYVAVGGMKMPKRTTIKLADAKSGAIQIRFDTIEVVAAQK